MVIIYFTIQATIAESHIPSLRSEDLRRALASQHGMRSLHFMPVANRGIPIIESSKKVVFWNREGRFVWSRYFDDKFTGPSPHLGAVVLTLSIPRAETMTPYPIAAMQSYLAGAFTNTPAEALFQRKVSIPWSFVTMMMDTPEAYDSSGLHVLDSVSDRQADILLNKRCNSEAAKIRFPYNCTCCSLYPVPVPSQIIMVILGSIVFTSNSHMPKATPAAKQNFSKYWK